MGQHWHTAQPVLRVYRLQEAGTSTLDRDIVIHGGVNNWYVEQLGDSVMTGDAPLGLPSAGGLVTDNDTRIGETEHP